MMLPEYEILKDVKFYTQRKTTTITVTGKWDKVIMHLHKSKKLDGY